MNLPDIVPVFVGASIGWVTTWLVSRHYYKKAGDKLMQEAAKLMQEAIELERLNRLNLRVLENAGIGKLAKDASGKPTGMMIEGRSTFAGEGGVISKGELIPRKSPNHNATEASDVDRSKNPG